jgi:uncharacterized Zn-binding protein involved in type VI secretion
MPPQCRLSDKSNVPADAHGCPGCPHNCTGPAIAGSPNVNVDGRPALRAPGDPGIHSSCCGPNTWQTVMGSSTVNINGKKAVRQNDQTQHCGGIGKMIEGSGTVFTGG